MGRYSTTENRFLENSDHSVMLVYSYGQWIEVLVDHEDVNRLKNYQWSVNNTTPYGGIYFSTRIGNRKTGDCFHVSLHRYITSFLFDVVDHKNRNTLDNRKGNLLESSMLLNSRNRNIKKRALPYGVYFSKCKTKFIAQIRSSGKLHHLGTFETPTSAHSAVVDNYATIIGHKIPHHLMSGSLDRPNPFT